MTFTTFSVVGDIELPYQGPQVNGPVQWARGDVAATLAQHDIEIDWFRLKFCKLKIHVTIGR